MNFFVKVILGFAALVLLALGAMFLLAGGDEAVIEEMIESAVAAARRGEADSVIGIISREFETESEDYDAVSERIRRVCTDQRTRVAHVKGTVVLVQGDTAEATFTVEGKLGPRMVGEVSIRLRLRREEGEWKVVWYERIR